MSQFQSFRQPAVSAHISITHLLSRLVLTSGYSQIWSWLLTALNFGFNFNAWSIYVLTTPSSDDLLFLLTSQSLDLATLKFGLDFRILMLSTDNSIKKCHSCSLSDDLLLLYTSQSLNLFALKFGFNSNGLMYFIDNSVFRWFAVTAHISVIWPGGSQVWFHL